MTTSDQLPRDLDEPSVHDQQTYARLIARSRIWALTSSAGGRFGRRTSAVTLVGSGLAVVLVIAMATILVVLIQHNGGQHAHAAAPAPAAATSRASADPPGAASSGTLIAGFENGVDGWAVSGGRTAAAAVTTWAAEGNRSLSTTVVPGGGPVYLARVAQRSLTGSATMKAQVRVAPGGGSGTSVLARLYVKTGPDWTWTDGGAVAVSQAATALSLTLTGLAHLDDVREIGVQFTASGVGASSLTVFVDAVTTS